MKRPALQNKQVVVLRMAFRARKVLGTFEKRATGQDRHVWRVTVQPFIMHLQAIVFIQEP